MGKADLLMLKGDDVTARNMLVKAVEIDPVNQEARRMLAGVTARMAGVRLDETRAGRDYRKREAVDLMVEARHATESGQFELAHSLFRRALSMDPTSMVARDEMVATETVLSQMSMVDTQITSGDGLRKPRLVDRGIPYANPARVVVRVVIFAAAACAIRFGLSYFCPINSVEILLVSVILAFCASIVIRR